MNTHTHTRTHTDTHTRTHKEEQKEEVQSRGSTSEEQQGGAREKKQQQFWGGESSISKVWGRSSSRGTRRDGIIAKERSSSSSMEALGTSSSKRAFREEGQSRRTAGKSFTGVRKKATTSGAWRGGTEETRGIQR